MQLPNLQAEFVEAMLLDEHSIPYAQPSQNMQIYKNNYVANLIKALQHVYPLIVKLLGEDFFRFTAKEYIPRYPSRTSNLHDYGEYFSDFLAEFKALKDLVYLPEVAQFEWICHSLFFAPDPLNFDEKILKEMSEEKYDNIRFILNPASRVVKFYFPIMRIIDLCNEELNDNIDINEGGVNLLILRRNFNISLIPLTSGEFSFLWNIHDGKRLADALETTLAIEPTFKLDEKLPLWVREQIICGIS